ncbi:MAG: M28 family metallopeptidase [Promethearchaeota archaeon]|jgi:hypothetical protein
MKTSTPHLYNEEAALHHVKSLAFGRQAATEGETKCINYITQELENAKIKSTKQVFEWSKTLIFLIKIIFMFIFIMVLINTVFLLYPLITWINLPLNITFLVVIYFMVKSAFDDTKITHIGKKKESKNVYTTIKARDPYPERPVIIFTAHHDSISQSYSTPLKMILYKLGAILVLSFLILSFTLSVWSLLSLFQVVSINMIYIVIRYILLIIGIILLSEIIILLGNRRRNKSVGSVDNGSGTAILIELAKLVENNPLGKTDVILFWCGAEEIGLWGSKQYCISHFEELIHDYDLEKSYNINIDMVGTYIGLINNIGIFKEKKINENLNDVLITAAKQQNIQLKKERVKIGIGNSDHKCFRSFANKYHKHKFQVAAFCSNTDTKFIHSKQDTPEKCSIHNLNGCIEICYNAIRSLDLRVV